jgi:hypothetical protein
MAIVSVSEMRGRSGSTDTALNGKRRAKFRVKTNALTHGPADIYNASGVPALMAADPEGGNRFVLTKSADQDENNPYYWVVTVEYGDPGLANGLPDGTDPTDPETRLPILVRSTWKYTKNTIKDLGGDLIANKAGQPPAEGLDVEICGLQYQYTKWLLSDGEALFASHLNHINDGAWKGHAIWTALCSDINITEERINGTLYHKHTYTVLVRTDGTEWDPEILNWGFKEKVGGALIDIVDDKGAKIQQPWFLDNAGAAVRPQNPLAADNFVRVIIYPQADFSTLW